nr:Tel2 interacting protein 1 [Echinococcus granulosus]
MISIILSGTGLMEIEELQADPSLPVRLWKILLNRVSLKNAEASFKNCLLLLKYLDKIGVYLDCNTVLNDLSSVIFAIGIDNSGAMSDEAWIYLIILIENCLLLSSFMSDHIADVSLLPVLAHLYSHILEIVRSQRGNKVRLRAISSIEVFVDRFNKISSGGISYVRALRASYFSKILPGISQALFAAVVGEKGRNSAIKASALRTLSKLVVVCVGNETLQDVESLDKEILDEIQLKDYFSFVENAISPLGKLLKFCSTSILSEPIIYSPSAKDRLFLALSDFSSDILCNCWRFLNLNTDAQSLRDHLLSSLIIVDVDDSCSSLKKASKVLLEISKRDFPTLTTKDFSGLNFVGLSGREVIDDIARQILLDVSEELAASLQKCSDENICRSLLGRMCGVLKFLGVKGISRFNENESNLKSCLTTLCKYLELDVDTVCLIDEVTSLPTGTCSTVQLFRKYFVHFRNPANLYRVLEVVCLLTCSCLNFDCVSQMFVRIMESDADLEVSSILLLSACASGLSRCDDQPVSERISLVVTLLDRLSERSPLQLNSETDQTAITQWPPSEQPIIDAFPTLTTKEQKFRCLKACTFMELLATASMIWGSSAEEGATYPDEMQTFILQMFGLATGAGLIASTAQRALSSISTNCGYSRFEEFTCAASEPILSSLTIDFHAVLLSIPSDNSAFSTSPLFIKLETACRALSYLVDNTTFEAIQRVQPVVMQMLICMDLSYEFAASVFLPVLRKIVGFCLRPNPTNVESSGDSRRPLPLYSSTTIGSEVSFIEKLKNRRNDKAVTSNCMKKALKMTSALVNLTRRQHSYAFSESPSHTDQTLTTSTSSDEQATFDAQQDQPITRPTHIRLAEEIMLRTIHMMSSSYTRLKVLAMSLLCDGCSRLTDEDVLLPLVHKIWSPLLARMQDRNPAVVEKAFELFATLTSAAGSFIRSRASTDLIGSLVTFLERGASVSAGATSSFECLTACRVQRRLLYAIGPICVQLELFSSTLQPVVKVLCTYTDSDQPSILREAAASSLWKLYDLDPGVVAYELTEHGFLDH